MALARRLANILSQPSTQEATRKSIVAAVLGPWQCHGNRENAIVDAIVGAIVGKLRLLNYCIFRFCVFSMFFRVFSQLLQRLCCNSWGSAIATIATLAGNYCNYCIQLLRFAPFAPYPKLISGQNKKDHLGKQRQS